VISQDLQHGLTGKLVRSILQKWVLGPGRLVL
jgi:hypothetical protein